MTQLEAARLVRLARVEAMARIRRHGIVKFPPAHIWLLDTGEAFVREGYPPPSFMRPLHLRGLDLALDTFSKT